MPNTPKGLTYPSNSSPVAVPADIQELATDVDGLIVPNTGGTYTGSVSFTNSPSVPTPTSALHAVNKTYADLINTDVTALETELGSNPSGTFSTVVERLDTYTDGFSKVGNLLTANQASVETDTTGFYGYQTTQVRSTAQAVHGAASLLVTATATGLGSVYAPNSPSDTIGADPGAHYTASVEVMGGSGTRSVTLGLLFYTAGGSQITRVASAAVSSPASWTPLQVTAVAPANAAFVAVDVVLAGGGSVGDSLYCDAFSLHKGAGGQWAMPGTPIPGLSRIAVNNAVDLSGTGTPEGVVTAAPGSTWLQTGDAITVSGNLSWRKATGTGNTGWIAEGALADTGWRDVSALLVNGWTGAFYLRRAGDLVTLRFVSSSPGGSGAVLTFPAGFRIGSKANGYNLVQKAAPADDPDAGSYYKVSDHTFNIFNWTSYGGAVEFPFTSYGDAWPTSLPGTPA